MTRVESYSSGHVWTMTLDPEPLVTCAPRRSLAPISELLPVQVRAEITAEMESLLRDDERWAPEVFAQLFEPSIGTGQHTDPRESEKFFELRCRVAGDGKTSHLILRVGREHTEIVLDHFAPERRLETLAAPADAEDIAERFGPEVTPVVSYLQDHWQE